MSGDSPEITFLDRLRDAGRATARDSSAEAESSAAASKRKSASASKQINQESKGKQAKLSFGNGKAIIRVSDDEDVVIAQEPSKSKKPRKKLKDDGEEAERKAMAARKRAAKKAEDRDNKFVKVVTNGKSKGKATEDGKHNAIAILSSSPIREPSPKLLPPRSQSRASSAETILMTESTGGPVSIILDSDGEEAGPSLKRKHPFFAGKSASGGIDDPILLGEDLPKKPTKPMRVTDSRPAHSFFSAKTSGASTPMERQISNSSTAARKKPKKEHAFFTSIGQGSGDSAASTLKPGWGHDIKEGHEWPAPWPSAEGHQTWPRVSRATRTSLPGERKQFSFDATSFWRHYRNQVAVSANPHRPHRATALQDTIPFIASHPAFRAIRSRDSPADDWAHKYAPKSAQEVLGNEREATYLRDWILALQVGVSNPEAQPIIRSVARPSRRRAGESWIAYDDDPIRGYSDDEKEEEATEPPPIIDTDLLGASNLPSFGRLTNTIVLAGPSGSGKTAAVYAAAHELGWDVFEVYPGVGKRNASSLAALVGEVSRNHMVAMNGRGEVKAGSAKAAIDLTEDKQLDGHKDAPIKAKQSVILLEEVDVLYEEDRTFWQAVVTLIAESRRPVILTCNDLSLVPCSQLPLQAIVRFQAVPPFLTIPYLETIARREGVASSATSSIRHFPSALHLHQPLPPRNSHEVAQFDLRQAIHQLQLGVERGRGESALPPSIEEEDLRSVTRKLDNLSFADAWIEFRPTAAMEVLEPDAYVPCADDEIGHSHLQKTHPDPLLPVLSSSSREGEMARRLGCGTDDERLRGLIADRAAYITSTLSFLDELVPLDGYLLPHSSLFLDIIPVVRQIVAADDLLDAADRAAAANGEERLNRRTGRPMRVTTVLPGRAGYTRYLDLSASGLDEARHELSVR